MAVRPVSEDDRERVRQVHAYGKIRNDIAREIGRSGRTVSRIAAARVYSGKLAPARHRVEQVSSSTPIVAQIGLSAPRVAVVFDGGDGWHYWARLAIHRASHIWGGRGFLLVPHVDGVVAPVLVQAARSYDPDYVVLLTPTIGQRERVSPGAIAFRDEAGRLAEGDRRADLVSQLADRPVDDAAGQQARQAVADACSPYRRRDGRLDEERSVVLSAGDFVDPLTPLSQIPAAAGGPYLTAPPEWGGALGVAVAARCGQFDEPESIEAPVLDDKQQREVLRWLLGRDSRFRVEPPAGLLSSGNDPERAGTAFERTTYGLGQASFGYRPRHHATFVVGDSAADFAAAYARQLLYGDGFWLPTEMSPRGTDAHAEEMRSLLFTAAVTSAAYRKGRVTICTVSAPPEILAETVAALRVPAHSLLGADGEEQRQLLEKAVVAGEVTFPRSGAWSYVVAADLDHPVAIPADVAEDGTRTMLSPTPVPDVTDPQLRESTALTWQVEVRTETAAMPGGRGLDGHHLLAPGVDPFLTWVRSSRHGPRFESHRYNFVAAGTPRLSRLARPKLRELSIMEWASALAQQQGGSVQLSPAGRRAEVLRRLLGDRAQLAATFAGPQLPVLRAYLSDKARTSDRYPNGEGVVLHAAGTNDAGYEGYLTFEGMKSFDSRDDDAALASDVDALIKASVLSRGIIVQCAVCDRVSFIAIDLAGRIVTCPRCQALNPLTSDRWRVPVGGPAWYFDLHPVARDLLREHGDVPLQLAQYLRTKARAYVDAAEFELGDGSANRIAEVDLPAYVDGELIVAETKSSQTLGSNPAREARKKARLADAFQADQLIFATTEAAWENASLAGMRDAVRAHTWSRGERPAVRIITSLGDDGCKDERLNIDNLQLSSFADVGQP